MDQNFLTEKNQSELVTICEEREIFGVSNQPKDILITIILNDLVETNSVPTREDLEQKSVTELREMLDDRDITGLDKQPKPVLVEILLNDYIKSALTGVQATLTVTKDDSGTVSAKVTVSCGGSQNDFDVVGHTCHEVAELLKEVLNIPNDPIAVVNGNTVDYNYVLKDGDVLDFVQKAEKKG